MSAKHRKKKGQVNFGFEEPDKQEYYFTEAPVVRASLPHLRVEPRAFLDVGSGKGEIASVVQATFPTAKAWGIEVDAKRADASQWAVKWDKLVCGNFFEVYARGREEDAAQAPNLIVTNPWFSRWHEVVNMCCDIVHPDGEVLAFGRVGTLEGVRGGKRAKLWDHRKWDLFPLAWRPTCTGSGRDNCGYMIAIFGPTRTGQVTRLYRLPQDEP